MKEGYVGTHSFSANLKSFQNVKGYLHREREAKQRNALGPSATGRNVVYDGQLPTSGTSGQTL